MRREYIPVEGNPELTNSEQKAESEKLSTFPMWVKRMAGNMALLGVAATQAAGADFRQIMGGIREGTEAVGNAYRDVGYVRNERERIKNERLRIELDHAREQLRTLEQLERERQRGNSEYMRGMVDLINQNHLAEQDPAAFIKLVDLLTSANNANTKKVTGIQTEVPSNFPRSFPQAPTGK